MCSSSCRVSDGISQAGWWSFLLFFNKVCVAACWLGRGLAWSSHSVLANRAVRTVCVCKHAETKHGLLDSKSTGWSRIVDGTCRWLDPKQIEKHKNSLGGASLLAGRAVCLSLQVRARGRKKKLADSGVGIKISVAYEHGRRRMLNTISLGGVTTPRGRIVSQL